MGLWLHLKTITRHRHLVIKHCFRAGIPWQGLLHDLSKYSFTELRAGMRYCTGKRSPNELERHEKGYSTAWMHHKGRNKHHFEYWTDYNVVSKEVEPVKMPVNYVVEMFCDRLAASKTYNTDNYTDSFPLQYYENRRDHRRIHTETAALIERLLRLLAESGEEAAFDLCRRLIKQGDY
jgi:hypothetical protein